jgi:hypothetical protein
MPYTHYTRSTRTYLRMQIIAVLVISRGVSQTDVLIADHRAGVQMDLSLLLGCPPLPNHSTSTRRRTVWLSTKSMVTRVEPESPVLAYGILLVAITRQEEM